jgi:hypothetical protein
MVIVIAKLLLDQNHRLPGWHAAGAHSPRLKTTPFHVRFARMATFGNSNSI